jgi:hypothetical protein
MNIFWKKLLFALLVAVGVGLAVQDVGVGAALFVVFAIASSAPIYFKYAHDNPQHLWFKRKLFGWGWTPVTWQGWLVIVVYIALVMLFAATIDEGSPAREVGFTFILPVALLTTLLIRICYSKGEKPRWQWGKDLDKLV